MHNPDRCTLLTLNVFPFRTLWAVCVCLCVVIWQEYSELLDHPAETGRTRDALLDKLKSRIRDRDKALEVLRSHRTIITHLSLH